MQPEEKPQQHIFVVAGMHRSGTSLTAALLQDAGVHMGERLMGASYSNTKGHFEDLDFVEFHEDVLYSYGFSKAGWALEPGIEVPVQYQSQAEQLAQQHASQPLWGWKDPRTTLFLNFWADTLPTAHFVFLYRAPWEVVDSLYRREDDLFYSNPNFALKVWMHYNQVVLDFCDRMPERSILCHVDAIARDRTHFIKQLAAKFDVPLTLPTEDIYDESLMRTQPPTSQRMLLLRRYFPEAIDLYSRLEQHAHLKGAEDTEQRLKSASAEAADYAGWSLQDWLDVRRLERELKFSKDNYQIAKTEVEQFHLQLIQTQAQLEQAQNIIAAMESSKFWQLRQKWMQLKQKLGRGGDGNTAF